MTTTISKPGLKPTTPRIDAKPQTASYFAGSLKGQAFKAPRRDTLAFSGGGNTTTQSVGVQTDAQPKAVPATNQPPAEANKKGFWNGVTDRFKVIPHAFMAMFNGKRGWMSWPFCSWKADMLQATAITLPLTILPGSQLILIPTWMTIGALARGAWTFTKGMWNPKSVLQEKKAAES